MNVVNGLPGHVLLVHFLVVLAPLTALLEIICGLWPGARRRLVWLVLALASVISGLTPVTAGAGQWLYDREKRHSAVLVRHADLGSWMIYFSVALLVVAIVLAVIHVLERRANGPRVVVNLVMAVLAVAVGVASMIQIYRIGDAGARAVWGNELTNSDKP